MKQITKYTEEYIKQICNQKDLQYIDVFTEKENNKSRRYIKFICNKHIDKGAQTITCDKLDKTKKPCCFCNHSKLKETFKEEMNIINSDIEILSNYVNWDTKIKCKCKKCGYEWDGRASVLLSGGGCKKCGYHKIWDSRGRKTTEEARNEINEKYSNIIMTGNYNGSHENTLFKCKIHNETWESSFIRVLRGECKCPICAVESIRKRCGFTTEEFIEKIFKDYPHITSCGKYINRETEMQFYCVLHNNYFTIKPKYLLAHKVKGCPVCSQSLGETKLINILEETGVNIDKQHVFEDCKYKNLLRFDVYDCDNNIVYEYQGEQHYNPIAFNGMSKEKSIIEYKLNVKRDEIKRNYCKTHNIKLIEIPYWEYDNMEEYIKNQTIKE